MTLEINRRQHDGLHIAELFVDGRPVRRDGDPKKEALGYLVVRRIRNEREREHFEADILTVIEMAQRDGVLSK